MRYLLIDGNFFMYRALHKMGELRRNDGIDTGMEYGFLRMLKTTVEEIRPKKTYVVFDSGISSLRLHLLPEYKSNRKGKGKKDKSMLIEMLNSIGISTFVYEGVEADDIIGLVSELVDDNEELIIASSDTDFCQLIKDNVKIYNPIKKEYIESPIEPTKYVAYKSMVGDTADNIHGIKGIGPKKALKRLRGNWTDWTPDESNIISINEEIIFITRNINEFGSYYPNISIDDFRKSINHWIGQDKDYDFERFLELCREMEFYSIENNLTSWQSTFGSKLDDLW
jgi:5'-3' exonuclease